MEKSLGASAPDILRFQIKRSITNTYKEALTILEELETEHRAALARLEQALEEKDRKLVSLADYWHEDKYEVLRRRILGVGNNSYRSVEEQVNNMEIKLK